MNSQPDLIALTCSLSCLFRDCDGRHRHRWTACRSMESKLDIVAGIERGKRAHIERSRCRMPVIGERVSVSIKKILLATDFSAASEKAASYARALARRF